MTWLLRSAQQLHPYLRIRGGSLIQRNAPFHVGYGNLAGGARKSAATSVPSQAAASTTWDTNELPDDATTIPTTTSTHLSKSQTKWAATDEIPRPIYSMSMEGVTDEMRARMEQLPLVSSHHEAITKLLVPHLEHRATHGLLAALPSEVVDLLALVCATPVHPFIRNHVVARILGVRADLRASELARVLALLLRAGYIRPRAFASHAREAGIARPLSTLIATFHGNQKKLDDYRDNLIKYNDTRDARVDPGIDSFNFVQACLLASTLTAIPGWQRPERTRLAALTRREDSNNAHAALLQRVALRITEIAEALSPTQLVHNLYVAASWETPEGPLHGVPCIPTEKVKPGTVRNASQGTAQDDAAAPQHGMGKGSPPKAADDIIPGTSQTSLELALTRPIMTIHDLFVNGVPPAPAAHAVAALLPPLERVLDRLSLHDHIKAGQALLKLGVRSEPARHAFQDMFRQWVQGSTAQEQSTLSSTCARDAAGSAKDAPASPSPSLAATLEASAFCHGAHLLRAHGDAVPAHAWGRHLPNAGIVDLALATQAAQDACPDLLQKCWHGAVARVLATPVDSADSEPQPSDQTRATADDEPIAEPPHKEREIAEFVCMMTAAGALDDAPLQEALTRVWARHPQWWRFVPESARRESK